MDTETLNNYRYKDMNRYLYFKPEVPQSPNARLS